VVGSVLVKRIIKLVVLDDDSIESISPAKAFEDMLPEILAKVTERIDRLEIAHSNPVVQGRHLSPPFGA
jgi:exoribonuclease II